METIRLDILLKIYPKAGADPQKVIAIRTTINKGRLGNKLAVQRPEGHFSGFSTSKNK